MASPTTLRRSVEAAVSVLACAGVAATVLWFYDWVSRWYVVVAVLLAVVSAALLVERLAKPAVAPAIEPDGGAAADLSS